MKKYRITIVHLDGSRITNIDRDENTIEEFVQTHFGRWPAHCALTSQRDNEGWVEAGYSDYRFTKFQEIPDKVAFSIICFEEKPL